MAIECQNCGLENRPRANFCRRCGRSLAAPVVEKKPPAPRKGSSLLKWAILAAGLVGLCLIIGLGSLFFFLRTRGDDIEISAGGESPISAVSSSGTGETPLPTSSAGIVAAATELPTAEPPTALPPAVSEPPAAEVPELSPQPTPTLESLIIPGTDIEVPRINDEEEIAIGRDVAREIEATYGIFQDPALESKVTQIGASIVPFADRSHLPYQFTLIDTDEINAFAAPGGFIFVSRGMLNFTETDGELASVIAHEIAHIAQRHSAEEIEGLALAEAGLTALLGIEPELAEIYELEDGKFAADMTAMLVQQGWSRVNELEADEYGVIYMARAGYEPREAVALMERMLHVFPEESQESDIFNHLSRTHPPFEERIQLIERVIADNDL